MQEQFQTSRVDFGNFQLDYRFDPSSEFPNLKCIDENYVATLRFTAHGASVAVVATAMQLEFWRNCLELSAARSGVDMETLPITCPRKENKHLHVMIYNNKLSFGNGTMSISFDISDCLNDFTSCINQIYCELDEKEAAW